MRLCLKIVLLFCCMVWPASADVRDFYPLVECRLPADIMQVQFADETWVYRLYEDGTVKKMVNKKKCVATCNYEEPFKDISNEQLAGSMKRSHGKALADV